MKRVPYAVGIKSASNMSGYSDYSQMMSMAPMSGSPPVPPPPTFPDKPADGADQATINSYVDGTLDVLKHCVGMLGSAIFAPQPPTNWYGF